MAAKEQETILRMVAAGTITPEQGAELLDALRPGREGPPGPSWSPPQLVDDALARALGLRLGERLRPPAPPRPPRPPHPPGPQRRGGRSTSGGAPRQGLSFEDLVELKTQGVPKSYIEAMRDLFPEAGLGELIEIRESGVEPHYARAMVDALGAVEIYELVEMRESGVDPDYARAMAAIFGEIEVRELVEIREAGVRAEVASALRAEFPDLAPSDVVEAAEDGVDAEDLGFFVSRGQSRRGAPRPGDGGGPGPVTG